MQNLHLFSSIYMLPGISSVIGGLLKKLCGGDRIIDLLLHIPQSYIDRRTQLSEDSVGKIVTFVGIVKCHGFVGGRNKSQYKVILETNIGEISLIFFNYSLKYLKSILNVGSAYVISGTLIRFCGCLQIMHPDYIVRDIKKFQDISIIEPVYPLVKGLTSRKISKFVKLGINLLPDFPEWIDDELLVSNQWYSFKESLIKIHYPDTLETLSLYRTRLVYDELFSHQIAMKVIRQSSCKEGISIVSKQIYYNHVLNKLPFKLTAGQEMVISEITHSQKSKQRMVKLLIGDVGSGKTVVALFAILNVVENGGQAALMVPTEILAEQHYRWIQSILSDLKISVELLTSKVKGKKSIKKKLQLGECQVVIGTHALFQDSVNFYNLNLIVIDEQHRFGVLQRMKLIKKGNIADVLFMTATPIPRTLEQVVYGDMDCLRLKDKPHNRLSIQTSLVNIERLSEVVSKLHIALEEGNKAYWICPYIEESELLNIAAAEKRFFALKDIFNEKVGLIHSRLSKIEKDEIMNSFYNGDIKLLIATTVIEVGVDVPDATIIIIENAEQFGLSQLHQLRGRVGRSNKPSFCILLHSKVLSKIAYKKLCILRQFQDGFYIAEQDLLLRGSGDILGIRQSGLSNFKFADIYRDYELISVANKYADKIYCEGELSEHLRQLLTIFGHNSSMINY
ncbi:ATP-dependent DNA helicase RecG [Ehrlichia ruminantium]|uniref:Probable DNA 3'-5' helicase RecG n=1 Tax=Ehrlichia ruminantium (strain Welgevonden) TaxID=254945 RepID=A0A0H3LYW5_EHRRW|nr:ATP-dependent DNA helicase RecG [Ehrlichia ruminantium]CAH57751.1 ATP-dependent DNA helicase RecG [Ehrlichia ruminantium str. Welgevonden]CAI27483.1 ATP-dependent DNA helicase RecG [Ehrlichia ruminantium str. Gardel]QLK54712.1 ATP-dependent DNA helicase RecG [Ehrlichia ruminantium]QLK55631.1 ATP-dependent DNA helicase RecG [Ehrlichia ruminantium]QLK58378.1 ATP-dependent DNA helicase RecG [Ehrlichia ruminantium]